jgi:hypothetical protein
MSTDSIAKIKTLKTIRGKDLKIRYTQDNLEDTLISQRQYFDKNGDILTPITDILLIRQVYPPSPTIARIGNSKPRHILVCFGSTGNKSGETNFMVMIPYNPGDANHNLHIQEISNYISLSQELHPKSPLSLTYQGENSSH